MPKLLAALLVVLSAGCFRVDFSRKVTDEEYVLRTEIRSYFDQVSAAYASANAEALAGLFEPGIGRPMTREQILAWAKDFFHQHGPARFKIERLEIESVGHVEAVVLMTYRVETPGGRGAFGGTERDFLVKRGGRWSTAAWDRLPDRRPAQK